MKHLGLAILAFSMGARLFASTTVARVTLPAQPTQLYINGQLMADAGNLRTYNYDTTALDPNVRYHYEFRAVLEMDGQLYDKAVSVEFLPGQAIDVHFALNENRDRRELALEGTAIAFTPGNEQTVAAPGSEPTANSVTDPTLASGTDQTLAAFQWPFYNRRPYFGGGYQYPNANVPPYYGYGGYGAGYGAYIGYGGYYPYPNYGGYYYPYRGWGGGYRGWGGGYRGWGGGFRGWGGGWHGHRH